MNVQQNIRVLIAEDDHLVTEMIKGLMEKLEYIVVGEATNGREAVEMTQSMNPDVVLMDIRMPDVDGIEATRLINERHPKPVVVLTAYETPELVERANAVGVGAYLVKPPSSRELERAIAIAMARFNDMVELRRRNQELEDALAQVRQLSGLLPICASCKKIRDESGRWHQLEVYIRDHSEASFSHGLCPECMRRVLRKIH